MSQVNYKLSVHAGYKSNICKIGKEIYDPLAYYYKDLFPDVELTRPNTDTELELLHTKCLLTVNGYIYPTEYSNDRLYIPNATTAMLKSKENQIGLLSFNSLPVNLIKHKISIEMVTPDAPTSLYEKAIITFDKPIGSAFLVLAGYLVFEQPEFFYRVSDRSFAIRLDRLNYMERIYELSKYRNIFNELGVPTSPNNASVVDANVVRSDSVITKFLSLFNSFLVEIPEHTITTRKVYLEYSNIPANFRTEIKPTLPVIGGYGKIVEYLYRQSNDTKYTVYTADAYLNNYLFSKLSQTEINIYNNHRIVGDRYQLSQAFFLEITCNPN